VGYLSPGPRAAALSTVWLICPGCLVSQKGKYCSNQNYSICNPNGRISSVTTVSYIVIAIPIPES